MKSFVFFLVELFVATSKDLRRVFDRYVVGVF